MKYKLLLITSLIVISLIISLSIGLHYYYTSKPSPIHRSGILKYLTQVYPAGKSSLEKLSDQKLLNFYNSLGMYYHCCYTSPCWINYSGKQDIIVQVPISPSGKTADPKNWPLQAWTPIGCCQDYSLPKLPSGYLYDWASYQYFKVPIIQTDSQDMWFPGENIKIDIQKARGNISTFGSQSLLSSPFNGIPPRGTVTRATKTGPSPFFAGFRSIVRASYYPFGPMFNAKTQQWTLNNKENKATNWFNTISDQELDSKLSSKNKWYYGYSENDYMEICHIEYFPGLAFSTGYWFNHFPGGGTGLFYHVGRTPKFPGTNHAPRNKVALLYTLVSEIASYTQTSNRVLPCYSKYGLEAGCYMIGDTRFKYGDELLNYMYNTTDPYEIVFRYCGSIDYFKQKLELAIGIDDKPFVFVKEIWMNPKKPSQKILYGNVAWDFVSSIQQLGRLKFSEMDPNLNNITKDSLLSKFNTMIFEDFALWLLDAELSVKSEIGKGYAIQDNGIWRLTSSGKKYVIDKIIYSNWLYDRTSNGVPFDEPNFYFGTILDYETLQMPIDANSSISWSFETIDLRLPEDGLKKLYEANSKNFPDNAVGWRKEIINNRKYPFIKYDKQYENSIYLPYATMLFEQNFTNISLSMRDPLNVNSKNVLPCNVAGGFKCNGNKNVVCKSEVPLSAEDQPSDNRYYYGRCTVDNPISSMSGQDTITSPYNYKINKGKANPIEMTESEDNNNPELSMLFSSVSNSNDTDSKPGFDVIVDTTNNFCMPNFGSSFSNFPPDKTWDGMGSVYCQGPTYPINAFWGNINYGGFPPDSTSVTGGENSVIAPNIDLF